MKRKYFMGLNYEGKINNYTTPDNNLKSIAPTFELH